MPSPATFFLCAGFDTRNCCAHCWWRRRSLLFICSARSAGIQMGSGAAAVSFQNADHSADSVPTTGANYSAVPRLIGATFGGNIASQAGVQFSANVVLRLIVATAQQIGNQFQVSRSAFCCRLLLDSLLTSNNSSRIAVWL